MSGVRNLRAMFENKDQSTSPPSDRGRSPSATGITSNGTSPRPLSKIRTSFVTVEKSGQIGLQIRRDASGEPSTSKRRTSFSTDEETRPALERKESTTSEYSKAKNTAVIEDSIPEVETPKTAEEKKISERPKPKEVSKVEVPKLEVKKAEKKGKLDEEKTNGNTNGTTKTKTTTEKTSSGKATSRPAPISTAKAAVASKVSPAKSPAVPRTPTTPRGRGRPEERTTKASDKESEKKSSRASLAPAQTSKSSSRPPTGASRLSASQTRIQASPPQTGFVKPKPKSPTRPVKLPASLMAHTASSGSKTATGKTPPRQSLSRASGNLQAQTLVARSPSRASTASAKSTLTRKASTLNKTSSRPSLGPPPASLKKQPSRQSLPKSVPADDSFLNRMMRPTTSSASKTAAAAATPPPQRAQSVKLPATREAAHKASESHKASPVARPVAKVASALTKPAGKAAAAASKMHAKEPEKKSSPSAAPTLAAEEPSKPILDSSSVPKPVSPVIKPLEDVETPDESYKTEEEQPFNVATAEVEEEKREEPISTANEEASAAEAEGAKETSVVQPSNFKDPEHTTEPVEEPTQPTVPLQDAEVTKVISSEVETATDKTIQDVPEVAASPENADVPEISEVPEANMEVDAEYVAPVPTHAPKEDAPSLPETTAPEAVKSEEDVKVEAAPISKVEPEIVEDPEDVKAREEIARMNAELIKSAQAEEELKETY